MGLRALPPDPEARPAGRPLVASAVVLERLPDRFLNARTARAVTAPQAIVLGGLGTFWGAMLGGITLGVAELVGLRLDPNAGPLYAHLLFLVGVLLRPNGLFRVRT